MNHTPNAQNIL